MPLKSQIKTPQAKDLVNKAKQIIDEGFDKMGRSIKNPSILDKYMVAATYKVIRFCEAISVLCENGLTDESLPILRSLIEHTINMRWIINKDSNKRLKKYMNDLGEKGFGAQWTDVNLYDRMREIGFNDKEYFDYCVKVTYSYSHVNSSSLIWGEVFTDPRLSNERWSPEAIYIVVAQMLGHVMKALDTHFVGNFTGYNSIWNQIKVEKNMTKKIKKIKDSFK